MTLTEVKNSAAYKAVINWIKDTFKDPYSKEVEKYLSEAANASDLEERMRRLTNRGFHV